MAALTYDSLSSTSAAPLASPGFSGALSRLIRVGDVKRMGGDDRILRREVDKGSMLRLARGCYLPTEVWAALTPDERYLLRIEAVARTLSDSVVISHHSAAALWGYPVLGAWPSQVHVIVGRSSGERSNLHIVRHVVDVDENDVVEIRGLLVTSPLRTLCDLARASSFASAVAAFDAGLHGGPPAAPYHPALQKEQILDRLFADKGGRGTVTAIAAGEFADGGSGSPGESYSRVQVHRLRMPPPQLQVLVIDAEGRHHHADLGWEESLGEFDGRFKYSRNKYTKGRPLEEVVWAEKLREDAMRAASGKPMIRWVWDHLRDLPRLERLLRSVGIRPEGERYP